MPLVPRTTPEARLALWVLVVAVLSTVAGGFPLWEFASAPTSTLFVYNLDPSLSAPNNDLVWDPNFLPGFNATPGVQINWSDPAGQPASLSYYVGPWNNSTVAAYPHFGVGPQAFNFVEVPRTQVFRSPEWGDYSLVRQGFLACAVNLGDYTVNSTAALHPVYVGMPETGVDWTARLDLHWTPAVETPSLPTSARLEIVVTTTLPPVSPTSDPRLVYTELVLWQTPSVSGSVRSIPSVVAPSSDVVGDVSFPVDQLPNSTVDRTYTLSLGSYLQSTLAALGLSSTGALLSYVYLSAAGYNVRLDVGVSGLWLEAPAGLC